MSSGPSKEELEMYWQNSRQYFDELAKHYQQADPEFYRKNIKPYYDNPFRTAGNINGSKSGSKAAVVAALLVFLIAVAAAGIFFFLSFSDSTIEKTEKIIDRELKQNSNSENETTIPEETTEETEPGELSDEDNYIIGAKYISEKKYDKAAFHLNRIKKGSKRYKEAQQLLESIKYLKKYNK